MKHFPAEILCNIFLCAIVSAPRFGSTLSITVPLFVSGVCRRWRNVSLSYGELWSYLSVEFDEDILGDDQGDRWIKYRKDIVEIFDTWLRRTNGCPVNFGIVCGDVHYADEESHSAVEGMLTELLAQQHRWRDVLIEWRFPYTSRNFPGIIATDMPLLTSLTLIWDIGGEYSPISAHVDISRSDLLQQLHIRGKHTLHVGNTPTRTLTGPIDLQFLNRVIDEQAVHACWRVIEIAPNIAEFRADSDFVGDDDTPLPDFGGAHQLELCSLRILFLKVGQVSTTFLDKLTLPALQALNFESFEGSEGGETLMNLFMRCVPPITCLHLFEGAADESTLIPVLHLSPALEMLWISDGKLSYRLFRELAAVAHDDHGLIQGYGASESYPLCPALQFFRVSTRTDESFEGLADAFIAMIRARRSFVKPLTRITFDHEAPLPIESVFNDYERVQTALDKCVWITTEGDNPPSDPFRSYDC
ncbi:hypothetical protein ACEPAH_7608 [Sanghuangporus vaninii]